MSAGFSAERPGTARPFTEVSDDDVLLREVHHRCANDLQLVTSMLSMQARAAPTAEARRALSEATARVSILARSRSALHRRETPTLSAALRQVCEALESQIDCDRVRIALRLEGRDAPLSDKQVTVLALAVNELVTNAIKHAFADGADGLVTVAVRVEEGRVTIRVDDDGGPFPPTTDGAFRRTGGLGLNLVGRLLASVGAMVIGPEAGSKTFEVRLDVRLNH